ncbi:cellular tumor antigen p53-like [Anopheles bellator]|uniref:cellular tumor antigen p53-like n=1 Tax=Anopheles bellator TaxID=139047 RepID=UPI002647D2BA|nr:cellular tumor antigen p53-like [Anopheles bellator]
MSFSCEIDDAIAEEDIFAGSGYSQQLRDFDSETIEHNALALAAQVNDDTFSLAPLSQDSFNGPDSMLQLRSSQDPKGKYPLVEELSTNGVHFSVELPGTEGSGWVYSNIANKLFVKIDSFCSFAVNMSPKLIGQDWQVRAMLLSSVPDSYHEPIQRCPNHRAKDDEKYKDISMHVIRCTDKLSRYVGHDGGTLFEERCAVLVPLEKDNQHVMVTLQFVCQNTCFKQIRKTAIVFTLEDPIGCVWGRRVFAVKICTNFRRDMLNEEKVLRHANVSNTLTVQTAANRPRKRARGKHGGKSAESIVPKRERLQIQPCTVSLEMPSMRMAKRVHDYAIGMISAAVLRANSDEQKAQLMGYLERIRQDSRSHFIGNSQCSIESDIL